MAEVKSNTLEPDLAREFEIFLAGKNKLPSLEDFNKSHNKRLGFSKDFSKFIHDNAETMSQRFLESSSSAVIDRLNELLDKLYNLLELHAKNSLLILEVGKDPLKFILLFVQNIKSKLQQWIETDRDNTRILLSILKTELFLQNHLCCSQNDSFLWLDRERQIFIFSDLLLGYQAKKGNFASAEALSEKCKIMIDKENDPSKKNPMEAMYYLKLIQLLRAKDKNQDITCYALELVRVRKIGKGNLPVFKSYIFLELCLSQILYHQNLGNEEQELLWADQALDVMLKFAAEKKDFPGEMLKNCRENHAVSRRKVFDKKFQCIKSCFEGTNVLVESFFDDKKLTGEYIRLEVPNGKDSLLKILRQHKVRCIANKEDSFICLDKLKVVSNESLCVAISEWKDQQLDHKKPSLSASQNALKTETKESDERKDESASFHPVFKNVSGSGEAEAVELSNIDESLSLNGCQ